MDKVTITEVEALGEPVALTIEPLELNEDGVILVLKSVAKHHPGHEQLETIADGNPCDVGTRVTLDVCNGKVDLFFPVDP